MPGVAAAIVLAVLLAAGPAAAQQRFVEGGMLVRLRTELPVEVSRVWDAWTVADELVQWFPHSVDMTVTEGGEYELSWDGQPGTWRGSFLEVERPEVLVFTWNPPAEFLPSGAYETTVRLTFEDVDGTTVLTLEHSGFQGAAEMESHYKSWREYLFNLRAYLLQ